MWWSVNHRMETGQLSRVWFLVQKVLWRWESALPVVLQATIRWSLVACWSQVRGPGGWYLESSVPESCSMNRIMLSTVSMILRRTSASSGRGSCTPSYGILIA